MIGLNKNDTIAVLFKDPPILESKTHMFKIHLTIINKKSPNKSGR